jgi:small subunit ribosomal protein S20
MPITKSAKKRVLQSEKKRQVNLARKSEVKTAVKAVITAVEASAPADQLLEALRKAESEIAQAKKKGVLHRNTAARKISRLAKRVAKAKAKEATR